MPSQIADVSALTSTVLNFWFLFVILNLEDLDPPVHFLSFDLGFHSTFCSYFACLEHVLLDPFVSIIIVSKGDRAVKLLLHIVFSIVYPGVSPGKDLPSDAH